MLTTWTPAHMPEKEEIKIRLQTARFSDENQGT